MIGLLYDLCIRIYAGCIKFTSLFNPKARLLTEGHGGIWSKLESELDPSAEYVWIHAASLGEFEQGRPFIEKMRKEGRTEKILLTFFSPSGYEVRKNFPGADIVTYIPFDTRQNVRHFLELVRPTKAVFVKYEFWRNCLLELSRRDIQTYLISAVFRKNQLFFKPYGGWYRRLLKCFSHIFVQDENSRKLLGNVGVDCVTVAGDTRFDRVADVRSQAKSVPVVERFVASGSPLFIVGSSWENDEDVYADWINKNSEKVLTLIAPHEFSPQRLESLRRRFGNCVMYSEAQRDLSVLDGARVLVLDCFGLLSSVYKYADVVWVGGGFGAGIHNINEPAVFGVPVLFGPRHDKFLEAEDMIKVGGGFCVDSAVRASELLTRLFSDKDYRVACGRASESYINSKLGATDRVYSKIFPKQ